MEAVVETLHFLAQQKKGNNQFKDNKQPEVPENQTAWNYDNQGVKETFTQTSRRGRDRQPSEQEAQQGGGPHRRGGAGWMGN